MIDIQPFINKLDRLPDYIEYCINNQNMCLRHTFYTKDYDHHGAREYFIRNFAKSGWIIGQKYMYWKKKSFEEWILTNQ